MSKQINIGGRLHSTEQGNVITGANEVLDDTKGKKQNVINSETDAELLRLDQSKQNNLTFDNTPTEESDNPVKSGGVYAADKALSDAIEAILILIPSAATALNQLADKNFVNSSIATDTATFRGTSETGLSEAQFLEWANSLTHDMNDYVFWQTIDDAGNTLFKRYKWNGAQWLYEYTLNNSSFTADQWAAIMSGITSALVEKLNGLPTNTALQQALNSKQDNLTFDNVPTENSTNPVKSGGVYSAVKAEEDARQNLAQTVGEIGGDVSQIEDVIPAGATVQNKLVANASMEAYVASIIQNITASFTIATVDGHINLTLTQVNGQVATLTLTSSDIASAQALTALTGRVTTAEGNITALTGRVSTNETDIANLQQLYNDLQQSKPVPVTALPETGQQQGVIYRLAGTTSYSDYMWNGSTWVLMATYDNAIDDEPTAGSDNLVKSGGVISGRRLDKNYIYSLTIYQYAIPFNLYYSNNRWRLSIYSCYYSFGSDTNLYQITAQEKECSIGDVSADPYAVTLYIVFDTSTTKTFDVYNNAQISNALANNQNLYVVAIGSVNGDGLNNFVSTFNFNVFGCQVNIKTNFLHDLYPLTTYQSAILFNLYYQNNDWYIDEYGVYINKLNHLGKSGNNTLVQENIGVAQNLSYVSVDVEGYYYYLFFNVSNNTLKLCTNVEYETLISDSSWKLIGYGNLSINDPKTFKCNVPFLFNGRTVSYSVLGSINNPKKVLWLGTSIPAGSTYPTNSCSALNRTCVNNARGTSWMCVRSLDTPAVAPDYDMSLTKTYAEFDTQYSPLVSEGKLSQDTLNFWKWNYSYESLVMSHISDYDVVVIDHIYNDFIDEIDLDNIDWTTRDRSNFIGAFNYLVDKILEANPFIKIIISTYFQNVTNDNQKSLSNIQKGIDILEKIAEHYGYPILQPYKYCQFNGEFVKGTSNYINEYNQAHGTSYTKLWEDANGNIKRFQMYCIDGVHPYTDEAKEYLDKVYIHLLTGLL